MNAETLRKTAEGLRRDSTWGDVDPDEFLEAVADWLDAVSTRYEELLDTFAPGSRAGAVTAAENVTGWHEALAVARAYLGESA